jgi:hypothetical protein
MLWSSSASRRQLRATYPFLETLLGVLQVAGTQGQQATTKGQGERERPTWYGAKELLVLDDCFGYYAIVNNVPSQEQRMHTLFPFRAWVPVGPRAFVARGA